MGEWGREGRGYLADGLAGGMALGGLLGDGEEGRLVMGGEGDGDLMLSLKASSLGERDRRVVVKEREGAVWWCFMATYRGREVEMLRSESLRI